jgi:hypothetical protein
MTEYELTRRDALAVLASLGIGTAAATVLTWDGLDRKSGDAGELDDHDRDLLYALAEIVYPSAVSGIDEFVETYVVGRLQDNPDRTAAVADSLDYLDSYAVEWYDAPFLDLSPARRETLLEGMGADVADPDPDGSEVERLRFYLINDLLYALYTSPTGGELVGIENPQGHPGGTGSYQRPPE